jgi:hypothetical protein
MIEASSVGVFDRRGVGEFEVVAKGKSRVHPPAFSFTATIHAS